mgnify:CR=1 FL=1
MRELLDDLTERQSSLAMKPYDYLDKRTRNAEASMARVENALRSGS